MRHDAAGLAEPPGAVGLAEPPAIRLSDQQRRWAILRWLSIKLVNTPHGGVLEAAEKFEEFVSDEATNWRRFEETRARVARIEAAARRILANAAEAELEFEELCPPRLRKPNRISRTPQRWPHKR